MKCSTRFCRTKPLKGRRKCQKCRTIEYRKKYKMKAAFDILKFNAKRRGKVFELTFEQFQQFAIETDYVKRKGKRQQGYTVDRIENDKGYTAGNIQVLTNKQNKAKFILDRHLTEAGMQFNSIRVSEKKTVDKVSAPF